MVRWRKGRRSSNIDDRRGQRSPGRGGRGGVKLSGGVLILALLGALIFGKNPLELLQLLGGGAAPSAQVESSPGAQPNDEAGEFVSVILASTEDVWSRLFQQSGSRYRPPTLVLFTDVVQSACGVNSAATG
ncbi:MAG: neutral zinc metallopeptidase, partial [Bacteroidota bacterium]